MSDWINRRGNGGMGNNVLSGRKQISSYVRRSWDTVMIWVRERGFPAVKINGVWESDPELIDQWRQEQINQSRSLRNELGDRR